MDLSAKLGEIMQAAGPVIEDSYLNGVTIESADWLPGLPDYGKIPANYRAQGRQGVQATLAVLLKVLADADLDFAEITYSGGFGVWSDPAYTPLTATKDVLGRVVVSGLLLVPATVGGEVACVLPEGFRPTKNLIALGSGSGGTPQLTLRSDGALVIDVAHSAGWISVSFVYTV